MPKNSRATLTSNKASKRLNMRWKNYCNRYWPKYIRSGYNGSFENYLKMCHLF